MKVNLKSNKNKKSKLISNILYNELSDLSVKIHKEVNRINNIDVNSGLIHSGTHYSNISNLLVKIIMESLETSLNKVVSKQIDLNLKLSNNEIEHIRDEIINYYQSVANDSFKNGVYFDFSKTDISIGVENQVNLYLNNLIANIRNKCITFFENHSIEMKLFRPNESIKQAKRANYISLFALFVSVVAFIYTIISNK